MSYGGSLDLGFGSAGIADLGLGGAGQPLIYDQAVQADGKVVVAGLRRARRARPLVPATTYFALTRLNTDGTTDASFGAQHPTQGHGGPPVPDVSSTATAPARAVAIQPDGKIVAAGDVAGIAEVVRLNADGTLDTTLRHGRLGYVSLRFAGLPTSEGERLALQPDGKILVAGSARIARDAGAVLRRRRPAQRRRLARHHVRDRARWS